MAVLHAGIASFLNSPIVAPDREAIEGAGANAAVLGLPYDSTTVTRPGASHGPRAIRDASSHFAFGGGYHLDYDISIPDQISLVDCGDVNGIPGNAKRTYEMAEEMLDEIYAAGAFPIVIGGDHGTTIPAAAACSRHTEGRMGFIMLDTHLDTAPEIGGETISHCSPAYTVLQRPNVAGENVVVIGAHGAANPKIEIDVAEQAGASVYTVGDIDERGIDEISREALAKASEGTDGIYLSVDIDVLDGGFAWGTCGPEIGGMTGRELVRCLAIIGQGDLLAADCVEVAPIFDPSGNTARIGARVVIDILAGLATKKRDRGET